MALERFVIGRWYTCVQQTWFNFNFLVDCLEMAVRMRSIISAIAVQMIMKPEATPFRHGARDEGTAFMYIRTYILRYKCICIRVYACVRVKGGRRRTEVTINGPLLLTSPLPLSMLGAASNRLLLLLEASSETLTTTLKTARATAKAQFNPANNITI